MEEVTQRIGRCNSLRKEFLHLGITNEELKLEKAATGQLIVKLANNTDADLEEKVEERFCRRR